MNLNDKNSTAPTTLSSSAEGKVVTNKFVEAKIFPENIDVFRFAAALAIRENLIEETSEYRINSDGQTWSLSSVDPTGLLKFLIKEFVFYENPEVTDREIYKTCEKLADLGLKKMEQYSSQGESFWEYLDPEN